MSTYAGTLKDKAGNFIVPKTKASLVVFDNDDSSLSSKNVQDAIVEVLASNETETKADKVSPAVAGNLASLNADGNLVDSGKKPQDFAEAIATETALSGKAAMVHAHAGIDVIGLSGTDYSTSRVRGVSAGTTDLTAGTSDLESGTIYLVYE